MSISEGDENKMWSLLANQKNINILSGKKHKSLPEDGWIRSCYFCQTCTSRVKLFFYRGIEYYTFRCKNCVYQTLE